MAGDEAEAIELIEKHKPDILLIDVIMPEYDGIHVVNHVRRHMGEYNPYIYMLSNLTSDFSVKILNSMEVDYISDKDIGTGAIIENLNKMLHYNNLDGEEKLGETIQDTLHALGLSLSYTSTRHVKDAVLFYLKESDRLFSRELYPKVAAANGVTPKAVEKNIRTAAKKVQTERTDLFTQVFPDNRKVTNTDFITTLAQYIKQQMQ